MGKLLFNGSKHEVALVRGKTKPTRGDNEGLKEIWRSLGFSMLLVGINVK